MLESVSWGASGVLKLGPLRKRDLDHGAAEVATCYCCAAGAVPKERKAKRPEARRYQRGARTTSYAKCVSRVMAALRPGSWRARTALHVVSLTIRANNGGAAARCERATGVDSSRGKPRHSARL